MTTLEQAPLTDESKFDRNYDQLRNTEVGVILADAYRAAVELEPRLEDIDIVPITDPEQKRHGFARPKWVSESGNHEVHLRLDDLEGTLAHYATAMEGAPDAIKIIAERLGVDPSAVTPQLMFVQSILHEMGHVDEFLDFEDNPDELRTRQKQEKAALPIGKATAGQLMQVDSKARMLVEDNWAEVQSKLGVSSMDELIAKQAEAYRGMTSEVHADNFATDVFLTNPMLYDQLMQPTVESYVNYPQAA